MEKRCHNSGNSGKLAKLDKPATASPPNYKPCTAPIQESVGTDYAFRLFVPKTVWVQVLAGLADETDYDNFKSEVADHQGKAGAAYEHSLHDVWSVMHRLQK